MSSLYTAARATIIIIQLLHCFGCMHDSDSEVGDSDDSTSRLLVGDPIRYESMRTFGSNPSGREQNASLFDRVGDDIATIILLYLRRADWYLMGQTNVVMSKLFAKRIQRHSILIARLRDTDSIRKVLLKEQMCCLDGRLLKKRLDKIPCYLRTDNWCIGPHTAVRGLFPFEALERMKTDNRHKMIRLFVSGSSRNYFCAFVASKGAHFDPREYFVFVFTEEGFESAFHSYNVGGQMWTQTNGVQCLGDLLLDDEFCGLVLYSTRDQGCMKRGVRCRLMRNVVALLVFCPMPWLIEEIPSEGPEYVLQANGVILGASFVLMLASCHANKRMVLLISSVTFLSQFGWLLLHIYSERLEKGRGVLGQRL